MERGHAVEPPEARARGDRTRGREERRRARRLREPPSGLGGCHADHPPAGSSLPMTSATITEKPITASLATPAGERAKGQGRAEAGHRRPEGGGEHSLLDKGGPVQARPRWALRRFHGPTPPASWAALCAASMRSRVSGSTRRPAKWAASPPPHRLDRLVGAEVGRTRGRRCAGRRTRAWAPRCGPRARPRGCRAPPARPASRRCPGRRRKGPGRRRGPGPSGLRSPRFAASDPDGRAPRRRPRCRAPSSRPRLRPSGWGSKGGSARGAFRSLGDAPHRATLRRRGRPPVSGADLPPITVSASHALWELHEAGLDLAPIRNDEDRTQLAISDSDGPNHIHHLPRGGMRQAARPPRPQCPAPWPRPRAPWAAAARRGGRSRPSTPTFSAGASVEGDWLLILGSRPSPRRTRSRRHGARRIKRAG